MQVWCCNFKNEMQRYVHVHVITSFGSASASIANTFAVLCFKNNIL